MLIDLDPGAAAVGRFMDLSRLPRCRNDCRVKVPRVDRPNLDGIESGNGEALPRVSTVLRANNGSFATTGPSNLVVDRDESPQACLR